MNKMEKSSEDKLAIRLKTGLIAEKGLAFSFLQSGLRKEVIFDWDYKTWWIGDVIAWAIFDQCEVLEKKEDMEFWRDPGNLKTVENYLAKLKEEYPKAYKRDVPSVVFHCEDVRERTGKRFSNEQVFNLVKKFVGSPIVRMGERFLAPDGDTVCTPGKIKCAWEVDFIKTDKLSNRNKKPEYYFQPIFDKAGTLDFLACIRMRLFDYRAPSYYSLKPGSQLIFRAIGWTKRRSYLTLEELCVFAGIKKKNVTDQKKIKESYLTE